MGYILSANGGVFLFKNISKHLWGRQKEAGWYETAKHRCQREWQFGVRKRKASCLLKYLPLPTGFDVRKY